MDISQPVPACSRGRRLARRCRILAARLRAALWRCVVRFARDDFGKAVRYGLGLGAVKVAGWCLLSLWLDVPFTVLVRARLGL
ncbi:hypothetical protein [Streptomyces purpurogeneiscleroticus]|uniref:hypothetical protein n=1 Tax=Streptomyces purpurogeneiscleroticus TaxID=68259 RepID=UPI001CC0BB35|nr:hypothetical protein [Streptomyces purpurogeneiscleroticus]